MRRWLRITISAVVGLLVTTLAAFALFYGFREAQWLIAPGGYITTRVLFRNYYAEPHMIGWPSNAEIVSILVLNTLIYGVLTYLVLGLCGRKSELDPRSSA